MRILIVEDNPTDRELLREVLVGSDSDNEVEEVQTLQEALKQLQAQDFDCILLDLQLPDSTGKDTFDKIFSYFPNIPIIVATHNDDRELALDTIRDGAADYFLKNYTDDEDIFQRITFAVEKHKRSVRVPQETARTFRRVEKAQADLIEARTNKPSHVEDAAVETTAAVAEFSRKIYANFQSSLTELEARQRYQTERLEDLDKLISRGYPGQPSMRSEMDLYNHRIQALEDKLKEVEEEVNDAGATQKQEAIQLKKEKMSHRTKVFLAILALIGAVAGTAITTLANYIYGSDKVPASSQDAGTK
jgi:CheY-like chemotaxis protein